MIESRIPVQSMSHAERALTPEPFARYLLALARDITKRRRIAALWIAQTSWYKALLPPSMVWDEERNARRYRGPWPIVAHPPCGPWGAIHWRSQQSRIDGILAMRMVHDYGGVVEQPLGSCLFAEYGRDGTVMRVDQADHGHRAQKATLLYLVGADHVG